MPIARFILLFILIMLVLRRYSHAWNAIRIAILKEWFLLVSFENNNANITQI